MKGIIPKDREPFLVDDVPTPIARRGEVLVRVKHTTLNPTDVDLIRGSFSFLGRLFGNARRVKSGLEFAGLVESDGKIFKRGDEVYGYINLLKGAKTHQEYIAISERYIALKPESLDSEKSSAIPVGALTTYVAIYEKGRVTKGMKVLVNGASGGLGVFALQFLKHIGAKVTALGSPNMDDFLKSLGADTVYSYKDQNITQLGSRYDVILDLTTNLKMRDIKHILTDNGVFIPLDPFKNMLDPFGNLFGRKKAKLVLVDKGDHKKLTEIAKLIDEEEMISIVDSVFDLADYRKAFDRLDERGKKGRIVLKM